MHGVCETDGVEGAALGTGGSYGKYPLQHPTLLPSLAAPAHLDRVFVADGILTQEVKLDVVGGQALHVLNLRQFMVRGTAAVADRRVFGTAAVPGKAPRCGRSNGRQWAA